MICLFVCFVFFYVKAFAILHYSHANKAYVVVVVVAWNEKLAPRVV